MSDNNFKVKVGLAEMLKGGVIMDVTNVEQAKIAEESGMKVVMNRCPKIEFARLFGELGWNGFNTGVISVKRRRI